MLIRLLGPDVPEPMLKAFATATDHAVVRPVDVQYDEDAAAVTMPMRLARVTSRPWLRGLGLWFGRGSPAGQARSRLVVRHVTTCKINVLPVERPDEEVHLIFGVTIDGNRLFACSAEETRGQTLFDLDVTFSTLDIELESKPEIARQTGSPRR